MADDKVKVTAKVRMNDHVVGTPAFHSGEIVEIGTEAGQIEPRIAKAWIDAGLCVPVTVEPIREQRA